jgi:hypothetical protein
MLSRALLAGVEIMICRDIELTRTLAVARCRMGSAQCVSQPRTGVQGNAGTATGIFASLAAGPAIHAPGADLAALATPDPLIPWP